MRKPKEKIFSLNYLKFGPKKCESHEKFAPIKSRKYISKLDILIHLLDLSIFAFFITTYLLLLLLLQFTRTITLFS